MTTNEYLTLIISSIAATVSIVAAYFAYKSVCEAKHSNKIAKANLLAPYFLQARYIFDILPTELPLDNKNTRI